MMLEYRVIDIEAMGPEEYLQGEIDLDSMFKYICQ